mgnify:CR=1 FL=1
MKIDMTTIGLLLLDMRNELQLVANTLKDKGARRFQRPLIIGAAIIFGAYYLLYLPPQKKLNGLQRKIESAKAASASTEAFKGAREQLLKTYAAMPTINDKDRFLTQAVVETLRAESLTSDSIHPPEENSESSLHYQKITVALQLRFSEMLGWLARLEASKPFLHISSLDLRKSKRLGYCDVQAGISTIVPAMDLTR